MTIHKALHPRDDIDRLYVSRREEGRGFATIKDIEDKRRFEDYIGKRGERLITATRSSTNVKRPEERQ